VVNNRAATLIEARTAGCRDHRLCQRSLDEPLTQSGYGQLSETIAVDEYDSRMGRRSLSWHEHTDLRVDIQRVIDRLPMELGVIACLLATDSICQVARRLGLSRSTIYRRIEQLRTAFLCVGLDQYIAAGSSRAN
jgi:transcriptional regulator of acetoin/glycerol metabolism